MNSKCNKQGKWSFPKKSPCFNLVKMDYERSLVNGVLAWSHASRALHTLRSWRTQALGVLGVLYVLACSMNLACLRVSCALKNGVLGVLKIGKMFS